MRNMVSVAGAMLMALALLAGCASAARSTALVAGVTPRTLIDSSHPLFHKLIVNQVTGGEETNILWQSKVSDSAFREGLQTSLDLTTMLAPSGAAEFQVDAVLEKLEQPQLAIDLEVNTTVLYKVKALSGETVFEERIATSYTEKFLNSLVRSERQRLANEGSVKANISAFIDKLAAAATADPAKFGGGA